MCQLSLPIPHSALLRPTPPPPNSCYLAARANKFSHSSDGWMDVSIHGALPPSALNNWAVTHSQWRQRIGQHLAASNCRFRWKVSKADGGKWPQLSSVPSEMSNCHCFLHVGQRRAASASGQLNPIKETKWPLNGQFRYRSQLPPSGAKLISILVHAAFCWPLLVDSAIPATRNKMASSDKPITINSKFLISCWRFNQCPGSDSINC